MQASLKRLRERRESGSYEGGFTLIELLIVIVILAILAAIVVFAVQNLSGSSAQAACRADFQTVQTATEAFKAQTGVYPGGTGAYTVTAAASPGTGETDASILDLMGTATNGTTTVGPWLKTYPYNAGHYQIEVNATGTGAVSVYSTAATPVQIGTTNTQNDCSTVS